MAKRRLPGARSLWRGVFAPLTAFLSEDFLREGYVADVVANVYTACDVALRERLMHDWDVESIRSALSESQGAIFDVVSPCRW